MKIIGITGRKRSGKDTVCALISKLLPGKNVCRFAFADALKREVSQATGATLDTIEKQKDRFRLVLQWWGTEFRRGESETYWLDKLADDLRLAEVAGCEVAVVTDCRFRNEADMIRGLGGKIVRVLRGGCSSDSHASETDMNSYQCDYVIENEGTLSDLEDQVYMFLMGEQDFGENIMGTSTGVATPDNRTSGFAQVG